MTLPVFFVVGKKNICNLQGGEANEPYHRRRKKWASLGNTSAGREREEQLGRSPIN